MSFYLGCAVWSYKGWLGKFYPPKTATKDFLSCYSQRFTTVEGNTTFYAVPEPSILEQWKAKTPSTFKFCLKFPQTVTHQGALFPRLSEAFQFLNRVRLLGDRLGCVFVQLPPSYDATYWQDLTVFCDNIAQQSIPIALEVRHLDWFNAPHYLQLNQFLQSLNIARVLLDTRSIYNVPDDPQVSTERRKPNVPLFFSTTADFTLIRYISHPQQVYNETYFLDWVNQIDQWIKEQKTIYFMVHCPIEDHSPFIARYFQQKLENKGIKIAPLPWNQLPPSPQQLSLFGEIFRNNPIG